MFDFEEWSSQVYRLNDQIEQCEANNEDASQYKNELKNLWKDLFSQENDQHVQFLTQILRLTKEVLNGEKDSSDLEEKVTIWREKVL